jgi:hypothetical protein
LLRALIGVAILIAAAWITSYATERGVLVSSRHLMSTEAYGYVLSPGATDEPVGHVCTYLRYDWIRTQYLVDQTAWDDENAETRARLDARPIENWTSAECPLLSEGLS